MTLIEKVINEGNSVDELTALMAFMEAIDIDNLSGKNCLCITATLIDLVVEKMNSTHEEVFTLLKLMTGIVNAEDGPIYRKDEEK